MEIKIFKYEGNEWYKKCVGRTFVVHSKSKKGGRGKWIVRLQPKDRKLMNGYMYGWVDMEDCNVIHELKILPKYFEDVLHGDKTFEVRKNDRNYRVGDILNLKEWDPVENRFTGRNQRRTISYILDDKEFLKEKYVILAFDMFKMMN